MEWKWARKIRQTRVPQRERQNRRPGRGHQTLWAHGTEQTPGADSVGSRNGAGSGADSVGSRNGAGSGADSEGSRNGAGSGADSV